MQTGYFSERQMERYSGGKKSDNALLTVGEWKLHFIEGGLIFEHNGNRIYGQAFPCQLVIKDYAAFARTTVSAYKEIQILGNGSVLARGVVNSKDGSRFQFKDLWKATRKSFSLSRQVICEEESERDQGFSTLLSLDMEKTQMEEYDFLAPGVWYRDNKNVVPNAIASDYSHEYFYIKETRLALPLVMAKRKDGYSLMLRDLSPRPDTRIYEGLQDWAVHESISYSALGAHRSDIGVSLDYIFPGSEGEINYTNRNYVWCRRSHPIQAGMGHCYQVEVFPSRHADFRTAMEENWLHAFYEEPPQIKYCNNEIAFLAGIELLDSLCQDYNGVTGLPFKVRIPSGEIENTWMQMGFVGQQLPAAYQLLRYGLLHHNKSMVGKATAMLDFWSMNSMNESGIPYQTYAVDPPVFTDAPDRYLPDRPEVLWLRTITDGLEAVVLACELGRQFQLDVSIWESYAVQFGEFLVSHQRENGSWARAYTPDGEEYHEAPFNTTNALRFLCRLYRLTGQGIYLETVKKAGEFCLAVIDKEFMYVGGTTDNDNTIDKEGGMIAVFGFLEMYETTNDNRYLKAAENAAVFAATWVYCWSYPVYPQEAYFPFAMGADITGTSLIATGHSGADVYMCYGTYAYTRLWELTGKVFFKDMAYILLNNAFQTTDWNGKYGFKYRGLSEEGGENASQSYRGVEMWLPWQTIAQIEPLSFLEDRYHTMDTDKLFKQMN